MIAVAFFAAGLLVGALHFASLRRNVAAYAERGAGARAIALHVARLALTTTAFVWLARRGGVAVLWTLFGFCLVRLVVTRRGAV